MDELDRFARVSLEIAAATRAKRERQVPAPRTATGRVALRRHGRRPELTRADAFSFLETFLWVFGDVIAHCGNDEREAAELERCANDPNEVRLRAAEMWVRASFLREVLEEHRREFEYLCHRAGYPWLLPRNEKAAGDTATFEAPEFLEELSA